MRIIRLIWVILSACIIAFVFVVRNPCGPTPDSDLRYVALNGYLVVEGSGPEQFGWSRIETPSRRATFLAASHNFGNHDYALVSCEKPRYLWRQTDEKLELIDVVTGKRSTRPAPKGSVYELAYFGGEWFLQVEKRWFRESRGKRVAIPGLGSNYLRGKEYGSPATKPLMKLSDHEILINRSNYVPKLERVNVITGRRAKVVFPDYLVAWTVDASARAIHIVSEDSKLQLWTWRQGRFIKTVESTLPKRISEFATAGLVSCGDSGWFLLTSVQAPFLSPTYSTYFAFNIATGEIGRILEARNDSMTISGYIAESKLR